MFLSTKKLRLKTCVYTEHFIYIKFLVYQEDSMVMILDTRFQLFPMVFFFFTAKQTTD